MLMLDLFCGAGGAAVGYSEAGFDVVGVDISPQPNYPFDFIQADALDVLASLASSPFEFVHASPPCQSYSVSRNAHRKDYPELLEPVRNALVASGLPYVIENVPGAPLRDAVTVCGAHFDMTAVDDDGTPLVLKRHRLFESNLEIVGTPCACAAYRSKGFTVGGVYRGGPSNRKNEPWKGYSIRRGGYTPPRHIQEQLMRVFWMSHRELCESIPPEYTYHIGEQVATWMMSTEALAS